jgi:hypothetical protein
MPYAPKWEQQEREREMTRMIYFGFIKNDIRGRRGGKK